MSVYLEILYRDKINECICGSGRSVSRIAVDEIEIVSVSKGPVKMSGRVELMVYGVLTRKHDNQ